MYFNDVSILQKLRVNSPQALYHSIFRPEIGKCKDVPVVPITFPFQESKMTIDSRFVTFSERLMFNFGFKTRNASAVLVHGTGKTAEGSLGSWEVRITFCFYLSGVISRAPFHATVEAEQR